MIRFGTTEKLELVTSASQNLHWDVTWLEDDTVADTVIEGSASGVVAAAGTIDVIGVPAANKSRRKLYGSYTNKGTANNTVTLQKDASGVNIEEFSTTLAPNESIRYSSNTGWIAFDSLGRAKTVNANGSGQLTLVKTAPSNINRTSVTAVANVPMSLWRTTGFPLQGAVPAAAAVCNDTTVGAQPLPSRTGLQKRIIKSLNVQQANANGTFIIEDRLAHMGGLNGTLATAQAVNLDLSALASNIPQRIGNSNYSEVEWWLEWYTATGTTSVTPSAIAVIYDDGSVNANGANLFILGATAIPSSTIASRRIAIQSTTAGRYIRAITGITMPTTGTAGNFGVTATRRLDRFVTLVAGRNEIVVYPLNEAPEVYDNACVTTAQIAGTTSTGSIAGTIEFGIVQ